MTAPFYTLTAEKFFAADADRPDTIGKVDLFINPPRIALHGVLIVIIRGKLRIVFPRRAALNKNEMQRDENGEPRIARPVSFRCERDWIEFSDAALAAIEAAFPGTLAKAKAKALAYAESLPKPAKAA